MILAQPQIREAVEPERFASTRLWNSGNGTTKLVAKRGLKVSLAHGPGPIADAGLWKEKILKSEDELGKKETFLLEKDEFILAQTYERIWVPRHLFAMVEGRSSYARAGLSMHQTAPWIQPGWNGQITLEIRNSRPLTIELTPTEDMPCQLTFFQLTSELGEELAYGARPTDIFQNQTGTLPTTR